MAALPVIMLTARSDIRTVQRFLQTGAVDYIKKAFTRAKLMERADQALAIYPRRK